MKKIEQNTKEEQMRKQGKFPIHYCLFTFVSRFYMFMCLLLPLLLLSLSSFSQPGGEIGVLGGGSYYFGEYNAKHFKNNQQYIGVLYRYNLNDRFAFRLNAGFSKIKSSEKYLLPGVENSLQGELHLKVKDFSGVIEFNFRSFMVRKIEKSSWWTPYMFAGIGILAVGDEASVAIPIGLGVKFNLYRSFSCGVEWSTRKLFSDMIDQLEDPWETGETNFMYNKDWFFVAGVTLTYRFPVESVCFY